MPLTRPEVADNKGAVEIGPDSSEFGVTKLSRAIAGKFEDARRNGDLVEHGSHQFVQALFEKSAGPRLHEFAPSIQGHLTIN